ncbi:hypothetical protein RHGRI_001397 [Rhododendron griersonianum]|uniref:Uncharacterized protein n=1 Tax=Rhododendron griersonianum TaxID=479676 RepID=A0AAV6LKK2_9ERIC|nr:hypothetical protein RHGRI_001397 [Rhododendron griersonianum]
MNVCDVQTYSINKRLIIFLNSRPYTGFPYGVTNVCNICHRSLPAGNFKFCCLSCKVINNLVNYEIQRYKSNFFGYCKSVDKHAQNYIIINHCYLLTDMKIMNINIWVFD